MAANTKTRDQILLSALKLADVPSLNILDVSNGNPHTGTINTTAMSIEWLQEALNYFLSVFPWAGNATSTAVSFTAGSPLVAQPADFILDLRDGLILTVNDRRGRLKRRGLQNVISLGMNQNAGPPRFYAVQGSSLIVCPVPDQAYSGLLWYWNRPADLGPTTVPVFPSDLILVEYVRIKAMEYIRAVAPGSALQYAEGRIAQLRKSGLGHEPEEDTIPLDPTVFIPGSGDRGANDWGWLGQVIS